MSPGFLYAKLPELCKAWQYNRKYPDEFSSESTEHLKLLIDYIHTEYSTQFSEYVENIKRGKTKFKDLACLFRTDQLLLVKTTNDDYQLIHCDSVKFHGTPSRFEVWGRYIIHDGTDFKAVTRQISIERYDKLRDVTALPIFPLSFHPKKDAVLEDLRKRGEKYATLTGFQAKAYCGKDNTGTHVSRPQAPRELNISLIEDPG